MAISKKIRQLVYSKCGGHCAYCGKEIAYKDMQVSHIYSQCLGDKDDIENLNPACRMCNLRKGASSIESFRKEIEWQADCVCETLQGRISLAYGLIERVNKPIVFYFEKINDND